jgi:hypothetical protein
VLTNGAYRLKGIGLEARSNVAMAFQRSCRSSCQVIGVETRHMKAALMDRSTKLIATMREA